MEWKKVQKKATNLEVFSSSAEERVVWNSGERGKIIVKRKDFLIDTIVILSKRIVDRDKT